MGHEPEPGANAPEGMAAGALTALLQDLARAPRHSGWARELLPGDVVGRFEIVRRIGRGGFGVVYEARDRLLGRRVAFKALQSRTGGAATMEEEREALAEAEAAANLTHPNIVQLHDAQRCDDGPYLIMELLSGRTLAERLAEGPLPPREAVDVAVAIARGIARAHASGVVHRDLKPSNVFLCEDGQVKVLDFGLARVLGRDAGSGGTPGYMAPEVLRGDVGDARADVFALGVVLREMLTGRRPAVPATETALTAAAVTAADGNLDEIRSGGEPIGAAGAAPAFLEELAGRLAARDPAGRPADGAEALAALEEAQRRLHPRTRTVVAWSVAALAVAAALAAAFWPRAPPLPPGRLTVALADTSNRTADPTLDGASEMLAKALEQSPRVSLLPRAVVAARAAPEGATPPARIDAEAALRAARAAKAHLALSLEARPAPDGFELEARGVEVTGDRPLFTIRERAAGPAGVPDALDRVTHRIRKELHEDLGKAPPPVLLAQVVSPRPEAWEAYLEGKRLASEGRGRDARAAHERAVAADPDFPLPHVELAASLEFSDRAAVEAHLAAALRHPDRIPPKERRLVEATAAKVSWDWARALERYDQVIAGWPDAPEAYQLAARLAGEQYGDAALARPYLEKVIELRVGSPLDHVLFLERLGRLDEALEEARRLAERQPGPASLSRLSWIHRVRGETAEALAAARRAKAAGARPLGDAVLWSLVDADALEELPAGSIHRLALTGRRREALAAYDARRPPETAPAFARGLFHNYRIDFLLDRARPGDLWAEAVAVLALGNGSALCMASELAYAGELEGAERLERLWPMVDPRTACVRVHRVVRTWRKGDPAAALASMEGMGGPMVHFFRAEMLLDLGRNREAVEELRRYRRDPAGFDETSFGLYAYPRSLYLEALALERDGDREGARAAVGRLLRMWQDADRDHPMLAEARALQARL